MVAIDGSKFKAVNNYDKNFARAKLKRRMDEVNVNIERYLGQLDSADREAPTAAKASRLQHKIAALKEEMRSLKKPHIQLQKTPDQQISLTDPDARSMKTRGLDIVGYNVKIAVDTEHHLIVAHEVTNEGHDRRQLAPMAERARDAINTKGLYVVADRGYYQSNATLACDEAGITTYLPMICCSFSKRGVYPSCLYTCTLICHTQAIAGVPSITVMIRASETPVIVYWGKSFRKSGRYPCIVRFTVR